MSEKPGEQFEFDFVASENTESPPDEEPGSPNAEAWVGKPCVESETENSVTFKLRPSNQVIRVRFFYDLKNKLCWEKTFEFTKENIHSKDWDPMVEQARTILRNKRKKKTATGEHYAWQDRAGGDDY